MKKKLLLTISILLVSMLVACGNKNDSKIQSTKETTNNEVKNTESKSETKDTQLKSETKNIQSESETSDVKKEKINVSNIENPLGLKIGSIVSLKEIEDYLKIPLTTVEEDRYSGEKIFKNKYYGSTFRIMKDDFDPQKYEEISNLKEEKYIHALSHYYYTVDWEMNSYELKMSTYKKDNNLEKFKFEVSFILVEDKKGNRKDVLQDYTFFVKRVYDDGDAEDIKRIKKILLEKQEGDPISEEDVELLCKYKVVNPNELYVYADNYKKYGNYFRRNYEPTKEFSDFKEKFKSRNIKYVVRQNKVQTALDKGSKKLTEQSHLTEFSIGNGSAYSYVMEIECHVDD